MGVELLNAASFERSREPRSEPGGKRNETGLRSTQDLVCSQARPDVMAGEPVLDDRG
jgi:hypothetical protein